MYRALALDFKSSRSFDSDGRMRVVDCVISKSCVSQYRGEEVPDYEKLGLDPNQTYNILRDRDELKKSLKSFYGLPILDHHVQVTAERPRMQDAIGCTGTDVRMDGDDLKSSLSFWTKEQPGEDRRMRRTGRDEDWQEQEMSQDDEIKEAVMDFLADRLNSEDLRHIEDLLYMSETVDRRMGRDDPPKFRGMPEVGGDRRRTRGAADAMAMDDPGEWWARMFPNTPRVKRAW